MQQVSPASRRLWPMAAATCLLAVAAALAGCGKKQDAQAVVGQVIAHVGPDDVTQQEVDNELRLANVPPDKRSDAIVKAILGRVIERKYLAQQAIATKLDREPTVHLDALRSREQILAGAYAQRDLSTKVSAISKAEVDDYIQAHPTQFAKRQIFQVEQISFPLQKDMSAISAATKDMTTLDQVEAKLNELGIKFSRGTGALDSATIPSELLKPLEARKPDDVFLIRTRTGASFFKVVSAEDKPLTGEDANNFAKREVSVDLAKKTSQQSYEAALASAKFEGDYARIMTTSTPATNVQAPAPAGGEGAVGEKPAGSEAATGEKPPGGETETGAEKPESQVKPAGEEKAPGETKKDPSKD